MKLKTSFFDSAVLKKDLLRFWPVWGLYLIGGLLVTQSSMAGDPYYMARELGQSLSYMGLITAIYGALLALLLFGDLFRAKMCNALHALPVRREAWFVSHIIAGILMCLVPNLVLALLLMPTAAQFWYLPLPWLGMLMMQFLFFFGASVFSIYLTGNAFAAGIVYALINFISMLVMWFIDVFYVPLLYGINIQEAAFMRFSPMVYFVEQYELWNVEHLETCTNPICKDEFYSYQSGCQYETTHDKSLWVFLVIAAAVGVVLIGLALLLYRKRKLECAGDFAAVKPMKTVFTVIGSIATGMLFWVFYEVNDLFGYILLLLGGIVGFFVCQMLLMRTIKVFGKKSWGKLGILVAAVAISLGLTAVDVFGITRIVPDIEDVVSVTIANSHLSDYQLERLEEELAESGKTRGVDPSYMYGNNGYLTLTETAHIKEVIAIHELLLTEGEPSDAYRYNDYTEVTVHYRLKNGTTLTRYYYGHINGEAIKRLNNFTNTPAYILGVNSSGELVENLRYVYYSDEKFYYEVEDEIWQTKLAVALYADAADGNLRQSYSDSKGYVEFSYEYEDGRYSYFSIHVPSTAKNTRQWAADYAVWLKDNDQITE